MKLLLLFLCTAPTALNSSHISMQEKKLLQQKTNKQMMNTAGKQLLLAAECHNWNVVKQLLRKYPELNLNIQDEYGTTALMWANFYNQTKIVKLLIDAGAELEIEDEDGNRTLALAIMQHNYDIAKLLVDAGAWLNTQNKKGLTPLMIACNQEDMIKLLIASGAIETIQNDKDKNKTIRDYIKNKTTLQVLEESIKKEEDYSRLRATIKRELNAQEQLIPPIVNSIIEYTFGSLPDDVSEQQSKPKNNCDIM